MVSLVSNQDGRGRGLITSKAYKSGDLVVLYSRNGLTAEKPNSTFRDCETLFRHRKLFYYGDDSGQGPLGVFVNDACDPRHIAHLDHCCTSQSVMQWAIHYDLASLSTHPPNVQPYAVPKSNELWYQATRPIRMGEPLYTRYGSGFWLSLKAMDHKADPYVRFACCVTEVRVLHAFPSAICNAPYPERLGLWLDPQTGNAASYKNQGVDKNQGVVAARDDRIVAACAEWIKYLRFKGLPWPTRLPMRQHPVLELWEYLYSVVAG